MAIPILELGFSFI
ncbi:hypothetical protein EYZ11_011486 [Aspergillus tanneri]|uniref:Uncharacterized protein n=1 Tax=Aspergillus tanneri TaxID=1220188 RepID=A0A4S3J4U9_9EURO|nr:hypothetical protein EYZ11_011486 [Aspergillus tanneri]